MDPLHNPAWALGLIWTKLSGEQFARGITSLSTLLLLASVLFVLYRWLTERRWKRTEALLERLRVMEDSPGARNAMMMLTGHDRNIPLWAPDEPPERRYVRVTWSEVTLALIPDYLLPRTYDPKVAAIRDSFQDFFAQLAQIELLWEKGLVDSDAASRVLQPWVRRFGIDGDPHVDTSKRPLIRSVRLYTHWQRMNRVRELSLREEIDLWSSIEEDRIQVKQEIEASALARSLATSPVPTQSA